MPTTTFGNNGKARKKLKHLKFDSNSPPREMLSSIKRVHESSEMNPSFRSSMEDEHRVIDRFLPSDPSSGYFAVYDGHGGRGVVEFLQTRLEQNVQRELKERENRSVEECITAAYLITDIECAKENLMTSGSTAVSCLIHQTSANKRELVCANVGDSRAVLSRSGVAKRLSIDHKANLPSEIERIQHAGGFVRKQRVMGILSVTRSFGDHVMKHLVSAFPSVHSLPLSKEDDILIIGCDGLWDVFEDQEAIDFCREHINNNQLGENSVNVAKLLMEKCLQRGTTDNVTILVIEL